MRIGCYHGRREPAEGARALYVAHYNLCCVHQALRVTPGMQIGVADHVWTISKLMEAALDGVIAPEPRGRMVGCFRVIDGGA